MKKANDIFSHEFDARLIASITIEQIFNEQLINELLVYGF